MKKLYLLLVVSLLLLSAFAIAESDIIVSPIHNQISLDGQASYEVEITNKADQTRRYSIYSLQSGQGWNIDPSPLKDKIIEVGPKKSYKTKIIVTPLEQFSAGLYELSLSIDSDYGESYSPSLKVFIGADSPQDYLPSIKETLDMDEKLTPGEAVSIKLFLQNKNPLNMKDLVIRMESEMKEFRKEVTVDLPPLQRKTVEFTATPSKHQQPKEYVVFFIFEHKGQQVKVIPKRVEVLESTPVFKKELSGSGKLLKYDNILTVTNEGNVKHTQKVLHPATFWQALFSFGADGVEVSDDGRFLMWEVELGPNESKELPFTTNYRVIIYLAVLIAGLIIFYFAVRSLVEVKKKAVTINTADDGTLSALKVTLEVRNKSKKAVTHVSVTDFVPAIANVEKSLELGTLKPKEIRHTKKGTKVSWAMAELDAHEHRLITYKVKAKLNILGTFSLPRATVEFKTKKGKAAKKAYSNLFKLG